MRQMNSRFSFGFQIGKWLAIQENLATKMADMKLILEKIKILLYRLYH